MNIGNLILGSALASCAIAALAPILRYVG